MRTATFEGSYLGDRSRLPPKARMECKICWYRYDPAAGDPQWQVPPGTPFAELPAHWSCPQCEGSAEQFMVVDEGVAGEGA
jgi:rubredoxin